MPSIIQKIVACCLTCTSLIAAQPIQAQEVSRSAFTSAISNHEPVDQLTHIQAGQQVYYFTELSGLQGRVITHKWEKDGTFQLGLQFPVGGERWRVQSSKSIAPNLAGTWTVTVLNDDGNILKQDSLQVEPTTPVEPTLPPTVSPTPIEPVTPLVTPVTTPTSATTSSAIPSTTPQPSPTPTATSTPATEKPIWETLSR